MLMLLHQHGRDWEIIERFYYDPEFRYQVTWKEEDEDEKSLFPHFDFCTIVVLSPLNPVRF